MLENIVNVTVRNRGTEDQEDVQVTLEITCLNNSYTFTDSETIEELESGSGINIEFEWHINWIKVHFSKVFALKIMQKDRDLIIMNLDLPCFK